ncbi:MAG: energy-coupling factor transporter transmembrane component T [Bacillota bacterium]
MTRAERGFAFDPRTKLVLVMCISSLAVILQDVLLMSFITLLAVVLSLFFGSALVKGLKRFRAFAWIFVLMVVVQSVFTSGGSEIFGLGGITLISTLGLHRGATVVLRILIIVASAGIMTTCSSRDIMQGLSQWRIPYELVFMVAVAIRFLPLLREEAVDILTAVQLRGLELDRIPVRQRLRVYSYLLMPMISSVLGKSQELALAVEMRGFRAHPQRTSYRVLKPGGWDYALSALALLLTGIFIWWIYCVR